MRLHEEDCRWVQSGRQRTLRPLLWSLLIVLNRLHWSEAQWFRLPRNPQLLHRSQSVEVWGGQALHSQTHHLHDRQKESKVTKHQSFPTSISRHHLRTDENQWCRRLVSWDVPPYHSACCSTFSFTLANLVAFNCLRSSSFSSLALLSARSWAANFAAFLRVENPVKYSLFDVDTCLLRMCVCGGGMGGTQHNGKTSLYSTVLLRHHRLQQLDLTWKGMRLMHSLVWFSSSMNLSLRMSVFFDPLSLCVASCWVFFSLSSSW